MALEGAFTNGHFWEAHLNRCCRRSRTRCGRNAWRPAGSYGLILAGFHTEVLVTQPKRNGPHRRCTSPCSTTETFVRHKQRSTMRHSGCAQAHNVAGHEHFELKSVMHTRKPILSQFDILLDQGEITMDHLIKRNARGRVSEKGLLFKINAASLGLLFPPSTKHTF
jgi:hypothetical protein